MSAQAGPHGFDQVDRFAHRHQRLLNAEMIPSVRQHGGSGNVADKHRQEHDLPLHQTVHHPGFAAAGHDDADAEQQTADQRAWRRYFGDGVIRRRR